MKKLLFLTWDGPETSYMEGLFIPIFQKISKEIEMEFHIIQFTWADKNKTTAVMKAASKARIHYTALRIIKEPFSSLGSLITIITAANKVRRYIKSNCIDIVMPRSTIPALIVTRLRLQNCQIIFDADGLPIEERVEFAGLKKNSFVYRLMKTIETGMLQQADRVITRSQKAIDIHLANIGEEHKAKFSVVYNGRDEKYFNPDAEMRIIKRKEIGVSEDELLFIYCGSLGGKYCWKEMIQIFSNTIKIKKCKLLVLTGNPQFAVSNTPKHLAKYIVVKRVPFCEVSAYLSAADVAFAIITPSYSMKGASATKLGEYLLMDLPVIASKGIGDSEDILAQFPECYLFDHSLAFEEQTEEIQNWLATIKPQNNHIREKAQHYFSLKAAADSYIRALQCVQ